MSAAGNAFGQPSLHSIQDFRPHISPVAASPHAPAPLGVNQLAVASLPPFMAPPGALGIASLRGDKEVDALEKAKSDAQAKATLEKLEEGEENEDGDFLTDRRLEGFANETGTAVRFIFGQSPLGRLVSSIVFFGSWLITGRYVAQHAIFKADKEYREVFKATQNDKTAKAHAEKANLATLTYQSLASLFGPIMLIDTTHKVVEGVASQLHAAKNFAGKSEQQVTEVLRGIGANTFDTVDSALPDLAKSAKALAHDLHSGGVGKTLQLIGKETAHTVSGPIRFLGNLLGAQSKHSARDTLFHAGEKLLEHEGAGKGILKFMASKPGKVAFMKAGAGFGAIAAWCMFVDPIVEALRENVINPTYNRWTNQALAAEGDPIYQPTEKVNATELATA